MKHKLVLALMALILVAIVMMPAFAAETITYDNPTYVVDEGIPFSTDDSGFAVAISGTGRYLTKAAFYLKNGGVNTGKVRAILMTATANNGTRVENGSYLDVATINTTYRWVNFTFSGNYLLQDGVAYAIGLVNEGATTGTTIAGGTAGDCYTKAGLSSAWTALGNGFNYMYQISTNDAEGENAPGQLPTEGSRDYSNYDSMIEAFTGFMVPLILILLPPALLCFITRRVDKWLIIIGLTIGAALLYIFLGTQYLWLVFLVTIGLIGMAYQSVRGGG